MNVEEINRLLYKTLEQIAPIKTSKVSMFDLSYQEKHPPYLRFKFENKSKDDIIYSKLEEIIQNFNGNLQWKLYSSKLTDNYIIMPCFVDKEDEVKYLNNKEYFVSILGEVIYNKKIESAISDIPELAINISKLIR